MSKQPEALRLADELDLYATGDKHQQVTEQAAAELRRLHAEVDRLSYRLAYPDNFMSKWTGLTDEEIETIARYQDKHGQGPWHISFARAIETKLEDKNT